MAVACAGYHYWKRKGRKGNGEKEMGQDLHFYTMAEGMNSVGERRDEVI